MNKSYALDASALISFLEDEPGADRVERLFREADRQGTRLLMSVVNLGEVFYHLWQQKGENSARNALSDVRSLPIELLPADIDQAVQAGEIKARHKIPYVDCIAAALAMLHQATLVTSDRDFEKLGRRVQVLWLARP